MEQTLVPRGPDHPWFDDSWRPVYHIRFPEVLTDEDVRCYGEAFLAWDRELTRSVSFVVDLTNITKVSAVQRRLLSEYEERFAPYATLYTAGVGFVAPSPVVRGLLTAIYWVSPPPYPYRVFSNTKDARVYAEGQNELTR